MTNKQEQKLREEFKKGFQEQFRNGMAQGVFAISKVIHEKATNASMSADERLADIIAFCEISIKANKQRNNGSAEGK